MTEKRTGIIKLLGMRRFLVVNLALLFLVGWGFTGELMRNRSMRDEIQRLQMQAGGLEDRNLEMARLAERYSGSSMLEREARLKLNLKKPGEEVVIVRDTAPAAMAVEDARQEQLSDQKQEEKKTNQSSNYRKWINHFFPN